jgi:hypothetical protein
VWADINTGVRTVQSESFWSTAASTSNNNQARECPPNVARPRLAVPPPRPPHTPTKHTSHAVLSLTMHFLPGAGVTSALTNRQREAFSLSVFCKEKPADSA